MSLNILKENLEKYIPYNEQEEADKEVMLSYINNFDNVLTRENKYGHFTSSAFVLNRERTKILMAYHKIYDSWAWVGGHSDGDSDLLHVAMKEAKEETGVKDIGFLGTLIQFILGRRIEVTKFVNCDLSKLKMINFTISKRIKFINCKLPKNLIHKYGSKVGFPEDKNTN